MLNIDVESLNFFDHPIAVLNVSESMIPTYSAVNEAWVAVTQVQYEAAIGKTAIEIDDQEGQVAYAQHLEAINARQRVNCDVRVMLADGPCILETSVKPIFDADGRVVQLLGTMNDRTAERNKYTLLEQKISSNSDIEDFISIAAHDLRTPMRNIQHITDMLREDFSDLGDGKLDLINLLDTVANKASELIADILAHADATQAAALSSKIESKEIFDVNKIITELSSVLDPLGLHEWDSVSQWVMSFKAPLQIVLRNLCDNAIKHSNQQEVKLTIKVQELPSKMLEFRVEDNGSGFSDPAIAFLDGGKLRMESGFGLFGVRRLILSCGGEVEAKNLPDEQGSVIRFTLPGCFVRPTLEYV